MRHATPTASLARTLARIAAACLAAVAALATDARPVAAQFGPVEALARHVSDLSFYYGRGGSASNGALDDDPVGLTSFGVELLFEVAQIPSAAARRERAEAQPASHRVLREVEVRYAEDGTADTVYHYDVVRSEPPAYGPDDILWTLEVGIGYGQVQGLELSSASLDLNAMIRTLPSITLYMSYEPWGTYLGLRTGFLRTYALQVIDGDGTVYPGKAEAFMMGGLVGYAIGLGPTYLFTEAGYTARSFPSVEWSAQGPLPSGVPRDLDVSGWGISMGLQFPVR
ncbi:MAG: hypothetical protein ACN0LA_02375 [Candidatus Longimicrobiales bacterium M2_2A_002]